MVRSTFEFRAINKRKTGPDVPFPLANDERKEKKYGHNQREQTEELHTTSDDRRAFRTRFAVLGATSVLVEVRTGRSQFDRLLN